MLNGDASSHPFHSLPPPPPPPPHSHQTLFSSFGYHRLSPSSADEPRYGQGSSPLASCSRWISFFSFKVCIESFLSARPLSPLPWCVCTRVRAGVCTWVRACACRCVRVDVCAHAGVCMRVCVRACRQACACRCGHSCMPSAPSPARPLQRCCSTPRPAALLPAHPTLATPVSPAAGQGWRQHRAAGSPCCARGPCSPAHPAWVCGNPQNHSPGSVPGGRAGQCGAWPGAAGAGTLYPLQPPPQGVRHPANGFNWVGAVRSEWEGAAAPGVLSWGMLSGLAQGRQCPAAPWGPSPWHGPVLDAVGPCIGSAQRADI